MYVVKFNAKTEPSKLGRVLRGVAKSTTDQEMASVIRSSFKRENLRLRRSSRLKDSIEEIYDTLKTRS